MGVAELVGSLRIIKCQLLLLIPLSHANGVAESPAKCDAICCCEIAGTLLQDFWLKGATQKLIILVLKSLLLYFCIIFFFLIIQTRRNIA